MIVKHDNVLLLSVLIEFSDKGLIPWQLLSISRLKINMEEKQSPPVSVTSN